MRRKRTNKHFSEYNEYHDRPFGLKWGTAFAMDELVKGIKENEVQALKENKPQPQMEQAEIETLLSEAFLYSKEVEIQLNLKDIYGNLLDSITGSFHGEAYEEYFVMENQKIYWEDVRHISVHSNEKWFHTEMFHQKVECQDVLAETQTEYVIDDDYQPFFEEEDG